jgi:hypothetical protein
LVFIALVIKTFFNFGFGQGSTVEMLFFLFFICNAFPVEKEGGNGIQNFIDGLGEGLQGLSSLPLTVISYPKEVAVELKKEIQSLAPNDKNTKKDDSDLNIDEYSVGKEIFTIPLLSKSLENVELSEKHNMNKTIVQNFLSGVNNVRSAQGVVVTIMNPHESLQVVQENLVNYKKENGLINSVGYGLVILSSLVAPLYFKLGAVSAAGETLKIVGTTNRDAQIGEIASETSHVGHIQNIGNDVLNSSLY